MVKIRLIACVLAVLVCLPTLKAQVSLTENDVKANEFGLVNGKNVLACTLTRAILR